VSHHRDWEGILRPFSVPFLVAVAMGMERRAGFGFPKVLPNSQLELLNHVRDGKSRVELSNEAHSGIQTEPKVHEGKGWVGLNESDGRKPASDTRRETRHFKQENDPGVAQIEENQSEFEFQESFTGFPQPGGQDRAGTSSGSGLDLDWNYSTSETFDSFVLII
jgi:hypothetical protein